MYIAGYSSVPFSLGNYWWASVDFFSFSVLHPVTILSKTQFIVADIFSLMDRAFISFS